MRALYPKLSAVKDIIDQSIRAGPTGDDKDGWLQLDAISSDRLKILKQNIRYARTARQFIEVYKRIEGFNSTIQDIFSDSLAAADEGLGDPYALRDNEIALIQKAHRFSTSSNSLFTMLAENTTCNLAHDARLCLSDFQNLELGLLVASCNGDQWLAAKCRWYIKTAP